MGSRCGEANDFAIRGDFYDVLPGACQSHFDLNSKGILERN